VFDCVTGTAKVVGVDVFEPPRTLGVVGHVQKELRESYMNPGIRVE
jgi:hypothetical protein